MFEAYESLNITETMLYGVSFAFLICIHTEAGSCMADLWQHCSARGRAVHILDVALAIHGNFAFPICE